MLYLISCTLLTCFHWNCFKNNLLLTNIGPNPIITTIVETVPSDQLIGFEKQDSMVGADIHESGSKDEKETKICDECEEEMASYDCLECKDSLCEGCYKHHLKKKTTKHHTLTPL